MQPISLAIFQKIPIFPNTFWEANPRYRKPNLFRKPNPISHCKPISHCYGLWGEYRIKGQCSKFHEMNNTSYEVYLIGVNLYFRLQAIEIIYSKRHVILVNYSDNHYLTDVYLTYHHVGNIPKTIVTFSFSKESKVVFHQTRITKTIV